MMLMCTYKKVRGGTWSVEILLCFKSLFFQRLGLLRGLMEVLANRKLG